jgi:serine/threonine-protein kinase
VADEGVFELKEAARVIRQIAEGLDHAHGKNIIHRDVTPNNIVFDSAGDAYITDFGIAKMMKGTGRFTGTEIMGTPAYISPEQATGESLDHRTDIYALGVVLYEMVIGDIPFHADTPLMMVVMHVNEPFPDPVSAKEDLPASVADVILRATAKRPDEGRNTCTDRGRGLHSKSPDHRRGSLAVWAGHVRPGRALGRTR